MLVLLLPLLIVIVLISGGLGISSAEELACIPARARPALFQLGELAHTVLDIFLWCTLYSPELVYCTLHWHGCTNSTSNPKKHPFVPHHTESLSPSFHSVIPPSPLIIVSTSVLLNVQTWLIPVIFIICLMLSIILLPVEIFQMSQPV